MPGLQKDLYIASNWEKLKEIAEKDTDFSKQPEKRLLTTAQKLYKSALECKSEGDEEKLYVVCSRYCSLVSFINKKYGKAAVINLHKNFKELLDYMEDLSNKLPKRYELIAKKESHVILPSSVGVVNGKPLPKEPQRTGEKGDVPNGLTGYQFISPKQLFDWLSCHLGASGLKKSILIIDVRPAKDYESSRIKSDRSISCPEDSILKGKAASFYGSHLLPQFKILWEERKFVDHLVLVDWATTSPDVQEECPLNLFKEVLEKWDPGAKYVSPLYILDGGFELWITMYPNVSTCSRVQAPTNEPTDSFDIYNISFPSLSESPNEGSLSTGVYSNGGISDLYNLSTRDHTLWPFSSKPPLINRGSKAIAELRYERSKQAQSKLEKDIDDSKIMLKSLNQKMNNSQLTKELLEQKKDLEAKCKAFEEELKSKEEELENQRREVEDYKQRERVAAARQVPKPRITPMTITDETNNEPEFQIPEERESKGSQEKHSSQEESKNEETSNGLSTAPLKHDTDAFMLRSYSTPNIAQTPAQERHTPPTYDRSNKPAQQSHGYGSSLRVYGSSRSGLTGLRNLGNTCYMNSVIQCISNTTKLTEYFCIGRYQNDINTSRNNPTRGEVAQELAVVIRELWLGEYRSTGCERLKRAVGRHMESFAGTSQQDSHEFLTFLINWLHKDLCRTPFKKQVNQQLLSGPNMAWAEYKKAEDSFVSDLFFIQQVSTVVCTKCHEKSVTYEEPTSNLTLQLPNVNGRCTLDACLSLYTSGEQISGYRCESCGQTNDATKKVDLWRLPQILVIHLKRFYSDGFYHKRQTLVDFPLEGLEMRNFTSNPASSNTKYNLYAVSNHYGTLEGGHYTAFCKNKERWYKFDDQDVTETTPVLVKSPNAYILFYEQV